MRANLNLLMNRLGRQCARHPSRWAVRRRLSTLPSAKGKTSGNSIKTTPSPLQQKVAKDVVSSSGGGGGGSASGASAGPAHSVMRMWIEGAIGASLVYGAVWGVENQQIYPIQVPLNSVTHVCASGVGLSFVARARGTAVARRLGVGALVGLWGLSGGLLSKGSMQASQGNNNTNSSSSSSSSHSRGKGRATKEDLTDAAKDCGTAILATVPFAAAVFRKRAARFSARNALGILVGSCCLVGAVICDLQPMEAEIVWKYSESYSRHPGLFLGWCHWFSYVLLGGGPIALLAGPAAMLTLACYSDLPTLERAKAQELGAESFREKQRTTSAFWPIKFSNRYVSDRRLYESVPVSEGGKKSTLLLGEWVVAKEFRPWTDTALGRTKGIGLKSVLGGINEEENEEGGLTGVLITRVGHRGNAPTDAALEVRFGDGRAFQMREHSASKFFLEPLEVAESAKENFWTRLAEAFANWIAADSWRLDPNECWILQSGGDGDEAFVVLSDGDMKTRFQVLCRPGSSSQVLDASALQLILNDARERGFGV